MSRSLLLLLSLCSTLALAESGYDRNPYPYGSGNGGQTDTLWSFVEDTRHLVRAIDWMQTAYPRAERAIYLEEERGAFSTQFRDLLQVKVLIKQTSETNGYYRPVTESTAVKFSKWAWTYHESAVTLHTHWSQSADAQTLQLQFYKVHYAYERSIVATYLLIDAIKRQYELDERTVANLFALHQRAQRSMKWLHYLRKCDTYASLLSDRYFVRNEIWEEKFGPAFAYGADDELWKRAQTRSAANAAYEPLLVPLLPKADQQRWLPSPTQNGNDAYATLRKEWEQIQVLLKDPANQNNARLRQRLWELQRLLTPGVTVAPGENKPLPPNSGANPAPQVRPQPPTEPAPVAPSEPEVVEKNPKVQQAILRIQYLLGKPEVQNQPELKKALEDLLQELRPGLPPLKPLPPSEDGEEKPKTMPAVPPALARFR